MAFPAEFSYKRAMNIRQKTLPLLLFTLVVLAAVYGYTRFPSLFKGSDAGNRTVLTVNGDRVTTEDVKRELAVKLAQDPSFKVTQQVLTQQLEIIVNRRILIQEATKRHLAEDESFSHTIRNFWEQTLIRNLMNRLGSELVKKVTVSDAEIKDHYSKLTNKVSFEIVSSPDKDVIDKLSQDLSQGKVVEWGKRTDPIGYEDIASPALENAFSFAPGESKIYLENGLYYLIRVAAKEPAVPPALSEIRPRIEARIKQRKQQAALEKWFQSKRAEAKIQVAKSPQSAKAPVAIAK